MSIDLVQDCLVFPSVVYEVRYLSIAKNVSAICLLFQLQIETANVFGKYVY